MNTYEALIVFKPIMDVDNPDPILKPVENVIHQLKGKILKVDKMGRKRLAYEISKFKDGYLTTFIMQLPPEAVVEFKKACQLNEEVLRLTLIRQDEYDLNAPVAPIAAPGRFRNKRPFQPEG